MFCNAYWESVTLPQLLTFKCQILAQDVLGNANPISNKPLKATGLLYFGSLIAQTFWGNETPDTIAKR